MSHSLGGRTSLQQEVLNASAIHKRQAKDHADYTLRQDAMSMAERNELNAICTNTTIDNSNIEHDAWEMNIDDVLAGTETIDISYAGGEFSSIIDIADDLLGTVNR
jgi:predicted polyphosphate/ATP-dependent NAD kinase